MSRGEILRPVAVFALSGLAVLVLVGIAGALALRSLSTRPRPCARPRR